MPLVIPPVFVGDEHSNIDRLDMLQHHGASLQKSQETMGDDAVGRDGVPGEMLPSQVGPERSQSGTDLGRRWPDALDPMQKQVDRRSMVAAPIHRIERLLSPPSSVANELSLQVGTNV
jgi:hypothetical protein